MENTEIKRLEERHRRLDASTNQLQKELAQNPGNTEVELKLKELKKAKLAIKTELNQLMKAEYQTREEFNFEDYDR